MKHFYKYFLPLFAAFGLLIGTGCSNIMEPLGIPDDEGGLSITVLTSSGKSDARTLFPNAGFTKFVLSFAGPEDHADVELSGETNQTTITDLASGEWTITATGYVTINGKEYPAASGKKTISCDTGTSQELSIPISAKQDGPEGFFSYSVQYPQAKVNYAYLTIIDITTRADLNNIDLRETASRSISLQPGYYLMTIRLNNEYQTAGHTEIIHIYSNMETKADYTYEDTDFVDLITLSGTATITINGSTLPNTMYPSIHARDENNNQYNVSLTGNTWSMKLPVFDTETAIYFGVNVQSDTYGYMSKDIPDSIRVKDESKTGINFDTINFARILISGTANITLNGEKPNQAYLGLYSDANYNANNQVGNGTVNLDKGTWSIGIEPFDTETTLYIGVEVYSDNGSYRRALGGIGSVSTQDKGDIKLGDIEFGTITLSGTANVTINGKAPDIARVHAYSDANHMYHLGTTSIDTADGTWSLSIEARDTNTPIYFGVEAQSGIYDNMWEYITEPTTVKDQDIPDIVFDPVNFKRIVISGTANITINDQKPNGAQVDLYSDGPYNNYVATGYVNLNNSTWSVSMEPLESETTTLYIVVQATLDNGWSWYRREIEETVTISNQDKSDIELGDIEFGIITLSGTASVTINDKAPDRAQVYAYSDSNYMNQLGTTSIDTASDNWSLSIESLGADTPIYFRVEVQSDIYGNMSKTITTPTTVKDQDIPDIDLGTVNFNRIAISGTVNVTVNGQRPNMAEMYFYSDENYSDPVGNGTVNLDNGTWSIMREPFATETTLYIEVMAYGNGGSPYRRKIGKTLTVLNQDPHSIDLGDIDFRTITLSGTANVTINSNMPEEFARVDVLSDSSLLGIAMIDKVTGTWSLSMEPFDTETPISFEVVVDSYTYGYMSENITNPTIPTTVKDQDIPDIDLGTVNFNRIAINGTVNVTVNGQRPNQAVVHLYSDSKYSNQVIGVFVDLDNGTWSIKGELFDSETTTLYIAVEAHLGNGGPSYRRETGETVTVLNQDPPSIDLGDIDLSDSDIVN